MTDWTLDLAEALEAGEDAVFDADDTLWHGDVGEAFHAALVAQGVLEAKTLEEYARRHATDFADAYVYATRVLAGIDEAWLAASARRFFDESWAHHIFPEMSALVAAMRARGVRVWIASASNRWVVEAGGARLGIDAARVIAMSVRVADGRLTDEVVPPPITRAGKAQALRARLDGPPAFVAGNSVNDVDMLRLATRVGLVVASGDVEPALAAEATHRGWIVRTLSKP